jgi:hypothetical protein
MMGRVLFFYSTTHLLCRLRIRAMFVAGRAERYWRHFDGNSCVTWPPRIAAHRVKDRAARALGMRKHQFDAILSWPRRGEYRQVRGIITNGDVRDACRRLGRRGHVVHEQAR